MFESVDYMKNDSRMKHIGMTELRYILVSFYMCGMLLRQARRAGMAVVLL